MAYERHIRVLCWIAPLLLPFAGRREWPKAQEWVGRALESALPAWLGSFEVVREAKEPFDPKKRYIFGYIHHGLYPLGKLLSIIPHYY